MMLAEDRLDQADSSSLRYLIIGGTAIRLDMVMAAMPLFKYALETCFGQTKMPQIAIWMRANEW